jgi:hypothetical protein
MMNWSLLDAPTGAFYITSDSPLTVWSDDDEDVIPGFGGFGSPCIRGKSGGGHAPSCLMVMSTGAM